MRATFPQFVDAERNHGSLIRAMRAARAAARAKGGGGKAPSAFVSPRGGMSELIEAIVAALGPARVLTGRRAEAVTALETGDARGRYRVAMEGGDALLADHVVVAGPANLGAQLLGALDPGLAAALGVFTFVSTATAFLAFRRDAVAHALDAVGFLVPRAMGRPILAGTWVTSKWESRAPEGHVLMRVFFGGAGRESILENDDATLSAIALSELRALMGHLGEPLFTRVFRFTRANPQPKVGHLARVRAVNDILERWPGVHFAGGGFDGVGIPDSVRQGQAVAAAIVRA